MAFTWANTFVAPNAISGFSSGAVTDIDEWPPNATDVVVRSHTGGASHTNLTFTFDMSAGPGEKKGFWVWMSMRVSNATGIRFDAWRLVDTAGPTTLYTNSSPGITVIETTAGTSKLYVLEIPDSAFSGNPNINSLALQVDTTNLAGGNNNFIIQTVRMMKSPFTTAQQASLPAVLSGQNFSCYRSSDLVVLGAANSEEIVVWPDASGRGRHLAKMTGTGFPILLTGTPDTVEFDDGTPSRLIAYFGTRITGNHLHHDFLRSDDTPGSAQAIWDAAEDFKGVVSTDKNILGTQSGPEWVLMSGDGTGPAHIGWGTYTTSLVRLTQWIQDSGNEHGWVNDNATPAADAAGSNSSNDMLSLTIGMRFTNDRAWDGGMVEHWWIDAAGLSEADIDAARDEWVNGPSSGATIDGVLFTAPPTFTTGTVTAQTILAGTLFTASPTFPTGSLSTGDPTTSLIADADGTIADVVNEDDITVDLYESVNDLPTSPNDSDWINNQAITASTFLELTATPSDFGTADSAELIVRYRGQNWSAGTRNLYARIYEADETTALSDEVLVATVSSPGSFTNTSEIPFTGLNTSANKSTWDDARIRFRWA